MNPGNDKPSFHLARVSGGEALYERTEIIMLNDALPGGAMPRRDFLGTGITAAAALVLLGGCGRINARSMLCAHRGYVNSVCVSPDGKLLASGGEDNTIKLWSLPDRALLKTLKGHANDVNSVCISPDGKLLASGSRDKTIKLWSLPDGALLNTLKGHAGDVTSVCISPDGTLLVSGSDGITASFDHTKIGSGGTIKLWSLPDGALFKTLEVGVTSVCISPDGKLLASGCDGIVESRAKIVSGRSIKLWSLPDGVLFKRLPDGLLFKTWVGHRYP
jgi:WD40 repeat protein